MYRNKFNIEQMLNAKTHLQWAVEFATGAFYAPAGGVHVLERELIGRLGKACKALGVTVDADGNVTQVNLPAGEESQPVVKSGDPAGIPKLGGDAEVQF